MTSVVTGRFSVRTAVVADAGAIADVWSRSIRELCTLDHGGDPTLIAAWCADKTPEHLRGAIAEAEHVWLVAADAMDRITAVGSLAPDGRVVAFYVDPAMAHCGIGTILLEALEAEAARLGLGRITLESSRTAQPFYLRRGFVAAGPPAKSGR